MRKPDTANLFEWLQFLFITTCIIVPIAIGINGFVTWLVLRLMGI